MRYRLKVEYDQYDTERPDVGQLGRMVSFSTRHVNYEDPEQWMTSECSKCEGSGWIAPKGSTADAGYGPDDTECQHCEATGRVNVPHPDVLTMLNYYEHGAHRWYVAPGASPVDMQWDGAYDAGVIVWNGEDNEREWWDAKPDAERHEILVGIAEEYTAWGNGWVFEYVLSELGVCDMGFDHPADAHVDQLSSIIGSDYFEEVVQEVLRDHGIDPDDVELVGDAAGYFNPLEVPTLEPALTCDMCGNAVDKPADGCVRCTLAVR